VYDVVIVGGGVMGSATAYYLRRLDPAVSVALVEKDPTYEHCSTLRSDGNVRVQFNLEENIRMSLFAMEVLETFSDDMELEGWRPDPAMRKQGNLFLADAPGEDAARAGMGSQLRLGGNVEWLTADEIAQRYPAFETTGVVGGTLGPDDGSVDPNAVLHGYRRNAARLGAHYIVATAEAIEVTGGRVSGVRMASGDVLSTGVAVNAAGGWAGQLAGSAGIVLPVQPVMRTVYTIETEFSTNGLPSIFLPSGLYVIPEGDNHFVVAWSRPGDPVGFDFTFSRTAFNEVVWPEIVAVLPNWDRISVTGGWTGIYAVNTLDGNAILGEWPEVAGCYLANGFSGHGFQHSPAVGRHMAELILGLTPSLDLTRLGPQRVVDGTPLYEHAGRII